MSHRVFSLPICFALMLFNSSIIDAGTKTWDGKYDTERIEVTVVYFVPSDRQPLPDWKERAQYYCHRIEKFHAREFEGQSTLTTKVYEKPFESRLTTEELRNGDANAIFFKTLKETDRRLKFTETKPDAFPILLVLSEINWRPLDDFYRLQPRDGKLMFEGINNGGRHHPGARSGGARSTYLQDRGVGWGLVSADGWRVPYHGSDCVIYHEGVGHTVGLPHPEPPDGSVMSMAQYQGGLNESWLKKEQKIHLNWNPDLEKPAPDPQVTLYTKFRATPNPSVPKPGELVALELDWPENAEVNSLRVRFQTAIEGPWIDVPQKWDGAAPATVKLGVFDRVTPVSYRIDVELKDGLQEELWGYLQVRNDPRETPQPFVLSPDLIEIARTGEARAEIASPPKEEIDLLKLADPETCWQTGTWTKESGKLVSPKEFGTRLELPYTPPEEYRLTLIVEPLDEPHALVVGQRSGEKRFVTLFNYARGLSTVSALENIDGLNVGNESTYTGTLFKQDQLSQAIVTVTRWRVTVSVDGRTIIDWKGNTDRLSLAEYWSTPNDTALFLGTLNCRYRFHRITLEPITGTGSVIEHESQE